MNIIFGESAGMDLWIIFLYCGSLWLQWKLDFSKDLIGSDFLFFYNLKTMACHNPQTLQKPLNEPQNKSKPSTFGFRLINVHHSRSFEPF